MDEFKAPKLIETNNKLGLETFGSLLTQSFNNLRDLNSSLDNMQETLELSFSEACIEDQIAIFKALLARSKYEASIYTSIMAIASKNEQVKAVVRAMLQEKEETPTKAEKLSPALKVLVNDVKSHIKETLRGQDASSG